jgi:hypothetical protein
LKVTASDPDAKAPLRMADGSVFRMRAVHARIGRPEPGMARVPFVVIEQAEMPGAN